jgi:fumarate reductase subunit D
LQKDTPKWGSFALTFLGIGTIATYVVAGLDVRWGWSSSLPLSAQLIGFIVAVIGNDILLVWAMVSNAYFVATFRIQSERNHTVVSRACYGLAVG